MASVTKLIFYLFLLFVTIAEGQKKKDKIVIHVPYKVHKHHHTHTKYKVLTVPNKDNMVIYLKEEAGPPVKHTGPVHIQKEKKPHQSFIPPHQQSAAAYLASLAQQKQNFLHADQQGLNTAIHDQRAHDSNSIENTATLVPNIIFKPILLSSPNVVQPSGFKPILLQPQQVYTPKLLINTGIQPAYEAVIPKIAYQPVIHLPKRHVNPKYVPKPVVPSKKVVHDNEPAGSEIFNTIVDPTQNVSPYKVKEENSEDIQLVKLQESASDIITVPSLDSSRKGKTYFEHLRSVEDMIQDNPDYEYEHIGYLIIDGKSKKVVGKNFKDEIHLIR